MIMSIREKIWWNRCKDISRYGDIVFFFRNVFTESDAANMRLVEGSILKHIKLLVQFNATSLALFLSEETIMLKD